MRTAGFLLILLCSVISAADSTQTVPGEVVAKATLDTVGITDTATVKADSLPGDSASLATKPSDTTTLQPDSSIACDTLITTADTTAAAIKDTTVRVAVIDFLGRGVDSALAGGFSDRFRILFSNICPLQARGPLQIAHRLDSIAWQGENPCDHNECFVAMGRALGVRYIIGGSVGTMGDLFTFALRMIDVQSEKVVCFKMADVKKDIPTILYTVLPALAMEFNNKLAVPNTAMASVKSEPAGATVMIDEVDVGTTPLVIRNITAGQHTVSLQKKTCRDTVETVTFSPGMWTARQYVLDLTDGHQQHLQSRYRMLWTARGAGVLCSVVALSMGLHYNSAVNGAANEQQSIVNEYKLAGTGKSGTLFAERYNHQEHLFKTWSMYRNFCYAASLALAAGVSISFVF